VFSFMKGIVHPYYNVVLAPAIGALVGIGIVVAWRERNRQVSRLTLAGALVVTVIWAFVLLERTPAWLPWLRWVVLLAGLTVAGLVAAGFGTRLVFALALAAALAAPAAYAVQTSATAHTGAIPSAGPSGSVGFGGRGGGPGFGGARPAFARGAPPALGRLGFGRAPGGGGLGGLLDAGTPSTALVSLLKENASSYRWVAAAVGANSAAGIQLATDEPVMAIGGFNGTDPSPTLAEFQAYVAAGKVHYFIGDSGGGGGFGSSSSSNAITAWVTANFTAQTVGGVTVYDLS